MLVILAAHSRQIAFEGYEGDYENEWSTPMRVFPARRNHLTNNLLPRRVAESLNEGELSMEAGAFTAACAMFGRALEAICRDQIDRHYADAGTPVPSKLKQVMLGKGIEELLKLKIIDARLHEWSTQLTYVRNHAAHASDDFRVNEIDAKDLETFVLAIAEYIYDLTERYKQLKARLDKVAAKKATAKK